MYIKSISYSNKYVNVLTDGEKYKLLKSVFFEYDIREGALIEEREWENILRRNDSVMAKEAAARMLARGDKSGHILKIKLRRKGFENDIVDMVISDLYEAKLIDDERYADTLVDTLKAKAKSRREIEYKLREAGVDEYIASDALSVLSSEYDENTLRESIERMWSVYTKDRLRGEEKIKNYFVRKGFEYESIRRMIREYKEEKGIEDDTY